MTQTYSAVTRVNAALTALLVALLFTPLFTAQAQTAGGAGASISPPITEVTLAPGETVNRSITVENSGSQSVSYNLSVNNLIAGGEGGESAYEPAGRGGLADWITLSPSSFVLNGGQNLQIQVTIAVPRGTAGGGHAATIFASGSDSSAQVVGTGAKIGTIIGAHVLANVSGSAIERSSILEFSTPRARLSGGETAEFTVRFSNTGTTNLKPEGVVELFRKGAKIAEVPVNASGATVLPGSTRKFEVSSDKTILAGAYTARLTMRYGSGQLLTAPELNFNVVAESQFLTGLVVVLAVLVGVLLAAVFVGRQRTRVK